MTIPSEVNRSGPYNGNGATKTFEYKFKIYDPLHLRVLHTAPDGTDTILQHQTDYTVTGVGEDGGGSAVLLVAPETGFKITLLLSVPFVQEIDLENQGAYFAEVVETALDLAAMRDQQLQEEVSRAVKLPASADASELDELVGDILRLADSADAIDTVVGMQENIAAVAEVTDALQTVSTNIDTISHAYHGTLEARDLAEKWASNPHGIIVTGDAYSSRHYAIEARAEAELMAGVTARFSGGTTKQFLVKSSDSDYDFVWVTIETVGDMLRLDYDPQGIGGDVFDLANMTGLLPVAKVDGLETALGDYYTKSEIDETVSQRDTAIAEKIARGGDTMTGDLRIQNTGPSVTLIDTDNNQIRSLHHNDGMIGLVGADGTWKLRVSDNGKVWTSELGDLNDRLENRAMAWANDRVANLNSRWVSRNRGLRNDEGVWHEVPQGAAMTGTYYWTDNAGGTFDFNYVYRYLQLFDPVRGWITAHYA
ncbi:hypothetical protein [Rhizobium sp. RM]|uniref:hypothetical protein n=1 Tax=Rhizobium sp. RM TaxID=2748079 RepID=UPI00110D4F0F|nr:hypothetical protein [Rhizobium sp. RM]NWJ26156.1 hypothetical protein [Rhizobium sp. RM]TMV20748.1 hypothetical protein BJG94_08625 [Rhizobium sp. Td3]